MLLCVRIPEPAMLPDQRVWEDLLDAFDALTPLIEDACLGLAYLDMRGIEGNLAQWPTRVRDCAESFGVPLRIAAGANAFCAYAAMWMGEGSTIPPGREAALLAPLPLDILGASLALDPNTLGRLQALGITTLGELAALPYGPFVRRFGRQAARWHACARGIDRRSFTPRPHAMAIEAATFGEGRVEDEAQVFFALKILLARVAATLERAGKRCGGLQLDVEIEDGATVAFNVQLAVPSAQERVLLDLLRAKLEGATFTAPIVGLRVRAVRLENGGEALALFGAEDLDPQAVAVTLARLEAALGEPARRARVRNAHPLEERFRYEPFVFTRYDPRALADCSADEVPPTSETQLVPQLRLLDVREIDVRIARGEPASLGNPPRAVRRCAGPWRVQECSLSEPIARDEYDVLLDDGEVARIYHQGAHWYLRGSYD